MPFKSLPAPKAVGVRYEPQAQAIGFTYRAISTIIAAPKTHFEMERDSREHRK